MAEPQTKNGLPLVSLLSFALVALTIEFDNAAELELQHKTTEGGGPNDALWLASMAMYLNCMKFVDESGIRLGELESLALTPTNLHGMVRWGYVKVDPASAQQRPKPDAVLYATRKGLEAKKIWEPLIDIVEYRWHLYFGADKIFALRDTLTQLVDEFGITLPESMPILGYGLTNGSLVTRSEKDIRPKRNLVTQIAKCLNLFAIEFEKRSKLSLAITQDILRVASHDSVLLKELPTLSGVSPEAIAMGTGFLERSGHAKTETINGKRLFSLTETAKVVAQQSFDLIDEIESEWVHRYGSTVTQVKSILTEMVGDGTASNHRLFQALETKSGNWRSRRPTPRTLPHFPMILHRGGFPDGS